MACQAAMPLIGDVQLTRVPVGDANHVSGQWPAEGRGLTGEPQSEKRWVRVVPPQ
jgi:hypothetical protein